MTVFPAVGQPGGGLPEKLTDRDVSGIAVNIASRITDIAKANEILVSRTVKDLVSGSGIANEDFGLPPLKGLEEDWRLFRLAPDP
jgi:class 3 adenylate cyclase